MIVFYALYYMHCNQCIIIHALYSMHCIPCIVLYALYFMHCIICIVFYALFSKNCILALLLTLKLVADRPSDQQTDRPTDIVTYRADIAAKNKSFPHDRETEKDSYSLATT